MKYFKAHLKVSFLELIRSPGFWVPTVLFPAMLYSFFGASLAGDGQAALFAIASFSIYAVIGVGFYQFGAGLAQERETAHAVWRRTLPGSLLAPWLARLAVTAFFALVAVFLVIVAGALLTEAALGPALIGRLLLACVVVSVPATLMGMALGHFASARTAVALANLIFLPLAFLGGLWIPPQAMPELVAQISVWTPTRQMAELGWRAVADFPLPERTMPLLIAYTLLFGLLTWFFWRRNERTRFR